MVVKIETEVEGTMIDAMNVAQRFAKIAKTAATVVLESEGQDPRNFTVTPEGDVREVVAVGV